MKAVILANGEFPTKQSLLDELKEAEFLIVCDGAMLHLQNLGIVPHAIIGDLDSIPQDLKVCYAHLLIHIAEQESNDLSKAFFYALNQGAKEFVILGATGKREDHTLANIFLLQQYCSYCSKVIIKSDFGSFSLHQTPFCLPTKKGEQISLFNLDPHIPLSSKGLKYPLENLYLTSLYMGSLNEALQDYFSLHSPTPAQIIVYQSL